MATAGRRAAGAIYCTRLECCECHVTRGMKLNRRRAKRFRVCLNAIGSRRRRRSSVRCCRCPRKRSTCLLALSQSLQPRQLHARRRRQLNLPPLRQLQRRLRCQRARAQQQRAAHDGVVFGGDPGFPRLRQLQFGGGHTRQLQLLGGRQGGEGGGQQVGFRQLHTSKRQRRCNAVNERAHVPAAAAWAAEALAQGRRAPSVQHRVCMTGSTFQAFSPTCPARPHPYSGPRF